MTGSSSPFEARPSALRASDAISAACFYRTPDLPAVTPTPLPSPSRMWGCKGPLPSAPRGQSRRQRSPGSGQGGGGRAPTSNGGSGGGSPGPRGNRARSEGQGGEPGGRGSGGLGQARPGGRRGHVRAMAGEGEPRGLQVRGRRGTRRPGSGGTSKRPKGRAGMRWQPDIGGALGAVRAARRSP